jgi:MoaA/NifB/PqqE/SkfB family radical SAM enzyme
MSNKVATIDFHITSECSQACPYCWGSVGFENQVDTRTALRIISRVKEIGVRRLVFTGGDPLRRPDAGDLMHHAHLIGLEVALSTTGDALTPQLLADLAMDIDLISLPLDGSTEELNALTKRRGHFAAIMNALDWLRSYPSIDIKLCTPVTRTNLSDVTNIVQLVEDYARTTQARVFYNVFQVYPRALFPVNWESLLVTAEEFAALKRRHADRKLIRINFLDHETLDKLYVMIFPDGSLVVPSGSEYMHLGLFLEIEDLDEALIASKFDSGKHLRHSYGWEKLDKR